MDKSPDAFRTISEVAEHLETPAHVLRFWESRFPQIRPVKRAGGRRYYRPSDVSLLTGIKRLLHDEGMTIRGVQKILREQGVRHVAGLSGDEGIEDARHDAPFVDQFEEHIASVVIPFEAEPAAPKPVPDIAAALEKVVEHGKQPSPVGPAPSPPLPIVEAAQGALLLTPMPKPPQPQDDDVGPDTGDDGASVDIGDEQDALADGQSRAAIAEASATAPFVQPDRVQDSGDFDVDDFDNGPVTTVASRIRSLPPEASAAPVGVQLLSVVARMQALRDRMADAARSGRS